MLTRRSFNGALVPALAGCATTANTGRYSAARRHAQALMTAFHGVCGAPALQVAVRDEAGLAWSASLGWADIAARRATTAATRFRIASVSKLFTGTLLAILTDRGEIDPHRPLGAYVEDIPPAWAPMTAWMIVHHMSGVAHYADANDGLDTTYYPTTRAALARFRDRPLAHAPGAGETYSSYAYTVLALAIEAATRKPFLQAMQEEVLAPLRLAHTGPDLNASPPPERSAFYVLTEAGELETAPNVDLSGRWAGSGYLSTAEDLTAFGIAHADGGALPERVRNMVGERANLPDGSMTREGFGWGAREDWDDAPMLWGDGATPGARCGLLVYPRARLSLSILANANGVAMDRAEHQLLAKLFRAAQNGVAITPAPAALAGTWRGSVTNNDQTLPLALTLTPSAEGYAGEAAFTGWITAPIRTAFQIGDTIWIVPMRRDIGVFPLEAQAENGALSVRAVRGGLRGVLSRA